ncbi:hypothetical protein BDZ85DRAFT_233119 [Elsinoe ampelina]|uniref:Uncharacterized protein n=1 Tax=Elsinoe ampelina TaxID=302913 RepID=A0A6A6GGP0_9PEZI|nr:hypothetical protein BDZ85DRAFT_233119 [Elsinoe ampelina]
MSLRWFPGGREENEGWRLDIVSLLAVIGESTVSDHAQTITASWLCALPRLMPAPQAMLRASRPRRLPPTPGVVVIGAFSGSTVDELNFAANLIHNHRAGSRHWTQCLYRRNLHQARDRLEARDFCPLNIITIASCLLSVGLFVWALILSDGVAAVGVTTLSLASSATGLSLKWKPVLATRKSDNQDVPRGDVILKLRDAAFVVVHCSENITREIYIGSDSVEYYFSSRASKAITGAGTIFLMVGVVLLGNCSWTMQAAIGGTFIFLNAVYWLVALLPLKLFWHVNAYRVEKEQDLHPHITRAHETVNFKGRELPDSYTRTLWYTIHRSRSTSWVWSSASVPDTPMWRQWISEAEQNVDNPNWDAVERKDVILREFKARAEQEREERASGRSSAIEKTDTEGQKVAVRSF